MRFVILLGLLICPILESDSLRAETEVEEPRMSTLEGALRVHPKYLYKYYIVFGDGQKCALYSIDHQRDGKPLTGLKPGAKIRVRGVLGTYFHRSTHTKENPSPFGSAWVLYMDVNTAEVLVAADQKHATVINPPPR